MASNPSACSLAYFHHPRYSSGMHGNDSSMQEIWQVLLANGVDIVLSGHDHDYERWQPMDDAGNVDPDGIVQFVVGTGGTALRSFSTTQPAGSVVRNDSTHGILRLRLRASDYDWEFLPIDGQTFSDWGTASCH